MTASLDNLIPRRRFTVDEYHRMGESGLLTEDDRVELIEGEIIEMAPIGSVHASRLSRLTRLLVHRVGEAAAVWPQNPVRLGSDSEPQPDLALLVPREDDYRDELPSSTDVLLVIEISDTSLRFDREIKLGLYARHAIPVVWIVNLRDETIEVYEGPGSDAYESKTTVSGDEALSLAAIPALTLTAAEVLG